MNISNTTAEANDSDEVLLLRIAEQDKRALNVLYQRYRQPLGSFLSRKIFANKLVDEAFNDVMLTVWQKAHGFRGDSKASTWIFGIAYRVAMSTARKESKHNRNRVDSEPEDLNIAQPTIAQDSSDASDALNEAIKVLSDNHRQVIELVYFHEKNVNEAADIIGIPINTVKTRLFHARQYLKRHLEPAVAQSTQP